jgi:SEC-C motif-containing protein
MRSRYTAYALMDRAYLLASWHPQTRPADLDLDAGAKWLGLDVRDRKFIDATHAEVEFVARYREPAGKAVRIHERSRFVQENGRWFYLDGDMT